MENVTTPGQILFLVALFIAFCVAAWVWLRAGVAKESTPVDFNPVGIIGDMWAGLLNWRPIPVKSIPMSDAHVMSRSGDNDPSSSPSSLQTNDAQTPDQTNDPAARRQKLLDTYRPLRKLGMSRDDARALLNRLGYPLDNNLWVEAAPNDEEYKTPIVGRATSARFEVTDPTFPYEDCPV